MPDDKPLFLPAGSVRALLILILTTTTCYLALKQFPIPEDMWDIIHIGIAFYFGTKVAKEKTNGQV